MVAWCLVVALQLAEYTEVTRCDRAFSVVSAQLPSIQHHQNIIALQLFTYIVVV
jgi:hypothetical protein